LKRIVIIAITVLAFGALTLMSVPRSEAPATAVVTILLVIVFVGLMTPAVRRAAQTRKGLFVWGGIGTLVLSASVLAAVLAFPAAFNVEMGAGVFCVLSLAGSFLVALPKMSATTQRAVDAQKGLSLPSPHDGQQNLALSEATAAFLDPIHRWTDFAQVVGPWLAAFCVLPLLVGVYFLALNPAALSRGQAIAALFGLVSLFLAGYLILIVASIQWTRLVATNRKSGWASTPWRALWGWIWRLVIFGSLFRFTQGIDPWLAKQFPSLSPGALHVFSNTLVYAAVVLATPFALSLTAVALGAPTRISEMRLRVFRLAGRKLYLGAALVLAPFFVITSLGDVFSKQLQKPPAMIADTCVGLTVFFLTGIAFAGYLARLYAKADVAG